jgi:hypothetical protein
MTSEARCGKPARAMIPRWGMYFACVLGGDHVGDCMPGGKCYAHGEYVGNQCPKWPGCIMDHAIVNGSDEPVAAPGREKEGS